MEVNLLTLRCSINKAYLKVKPNRTQIETFKKNITNLFDQIKESESEEFHKNIISEFLKNTYYSPTNYINTRGRYDLVIHNGKDSDSSVGVIFETKKPGNKAEMPTSKNINTKAFQELILYYLQERITNRNIEIKYLVITDIFEWFIFNAGDFERIFASDKNLIRQFADFEEGRLSGTNTDFFYKNIAEQFVDESGSDIPVTYLDIRDFETIIKNADKEEDNKLIALYKIFSPEHLLKLPFANDSNNLDKSFYNELLHIIGLEETKEGSKKIIGRKIEKKRDAGSLIENAITILKSEDCLSQVPKLSEYGNDKEEQLFNIALELVITWINRILFLKLLEGQLVRYNSGNKSFRFLNIERIPDYDELNKLFFQVLAVKEDDRSESIKQKFSNIPYLNSSLFEPSEFEHKTIRINSLDEHSNLPVLSGTVLKDKTGRKLTGDIDPVQYLFEFLDSYDFSSEGSEEIQEENKTLINASVLGLIFEKINGYKDGSFFTPGFITMYMCHETIRRAIVQKFNEVKGWKCETITDVYNEIEDVKEANKIINGLRICDPAVGSGHFLVSALNEIIAIKSELKILTDREGKKLKEYTIEVINDELIITDEQSRLFEYNPKSKESQRVQETLFQEKQKIIESCLFGVDINPNSVKICRLRLWIELLKNAYYKSGTPQTARLAPHAELETLPNIDINIKCGNSLISRYPLDADIKTALKSSKWNVDNYREAIMTYRNAQSKDEKRAMEDLIAKIKNDFESEVSKSDKRFLRLNKLSGELLGLTNQSTLFDLPKKEKDEWNKKINKLTEEIKKYETELAEIKNNKIYENAFEWRFEFPEVLNNDGDFMGFDVVIGNPPYIRQEALSRIKNYLEENYIVFQSLADLLTYFIELSYNLLKKNGTFQFIVSNKFTRANYGQTLRKFLAEKTQITHFIDFGGVSIFDEATVDASILGFTKKISNNNDQLILREIKKGDNILDNFDRYISDFAILYSNKALTMTTWSFENPQSLSIARKIEKIGTQLKDWNITINFGIKTGYNEAFIIDESTKKRLIEDNRNSAEIIKPILRGRDIKKYFSEDSGTFIINSHNGLKKKKIPSIDVEKNYIGIFNYLKSFLPEIKSRQDKGDHWTNLRNCAYLEDFEKPKLIWKRIGSILRFSYDESGTYCLDSTCIATGEKVKFLCAVLNSKLCNSELFRIAPKTGTGDLIISVQALEPLNVPIPDKEQEEEILKIFDQILSLKKSNSSADTSTLEAEIERLVYELYGLTEEEIRIVEG
jgi:type II restriction/modification system DNA methylase subunit YeeA